MKRLVFLSLLLSLPSPHLVTAAVVQRTATATLTAVELNHGDTLAFTLANGKTRELTLLETWARVVLTNLQTPKKGFPGGGTVYAFGCHVDIDGQRMTMIRYVPVQASFYEPYVVDGMRIWFDGVQKIGDLFNENHGACVPTKAARFAVQDMTLPICSEEEIRPWYPNARNQIDVHESYNGDDVWMGTYFGADLHGGLDVNMPIGTALWAPISFDNQFFFNSLAKGHNNNRWRAIRRWSNGQRWVLQAHHITRLLVPENTPLSQNTHYAVAAGVLTGSHAHSHFVFKVGEENEEILLDPWILFWQIFENNRRRAGDIQVKIPPVDPIRTGAKVRFQSVGSKAGVTGNKMSFCWAFGDGGSSRDVDPTHVYAEPGIYPVTLTGSDGTQLVSTTQHISVSGDKLESPVLALDAPDEREFAMRPAAAMAIYGDAPQFMPHTLRFVARRASSVRPPSKLIEVKNLGGKVLSPLVFRVQYLEVDGWVRIVRRGEGNSQILDVSVDATRFKPKHGVYHAVVHVECPGAINSPQCFSIELTTPRHKPQQDVVVDNEDARCQASPYFWIAPRFHGPWPTGWRGTYLVAGGQPVTDGWIRFQPDLAAGRYQIQLHEQTPFQPTKQADPQIRFPVTVRHKHGRENVWIEPMKSPAIGTFEFSEGTSGYVEISTKGSTGLVVADAVRFKRIAESP